MGNTFRRSDVVTEIVIAGLDPAIHLDRFLNKIEAQLPAGKIVHVVLDNYAAHNC
ncbi:MAG: hypothetical protein JOZ74_08970 [Bradyrhizobium sp.]|nr:hypothetical protein [Bradyrhizobium sp.]